MTGPRHPCGLFHEVTEMIALNHPQRDGTPQFNTARTHFYHFPIAASRTAIDVDFVAQLKLIGSKNCDDLRALISLGFICFLFRIAHLV
jgi:hypothetical protein